MASRWSPGKLSGAARFLTSVFGLHPCSIRGPKTSLDLGSEELGQGPDPDAGIVSGRGKQPPVGRERHAGEPIGRFAHLAR
jgi:hypothetical protein